MNLDGKTLLHRMRLRGPWGICEQDLSGDAVDSSPSTVKVPVSWQELFGNRNGSAIFTRHFNRPTGLEQTDQVWLALQSPGMECQIQMSDTSLPSFELSVSAGETWTTTDLTTKLDTHNRLRIKLSTRSDSIKPEPSIGLWAAPELWIVGTTSSTTP